MTYMVFCGYADYTHNRRMKNNTQNTKGTIAVFVELCKLIPAYLRANALGFCHTKLIKYILFIDCEFLKILNINNNF